MDEWEFSSVSMWMGVGNKSKEENWEFAKNANVIYYS